MEDLARLVINTPGMHAELVLLAKRQAEWQQGPKADPLPLKQAQFAGMWLANVASVAGAEAYTAADILFAAMALEGSYSALVALQAAAMAKTDEAKP